MKILPALGLITLLSVTSAWADTTTIALNQAGAWTAILSSGTYAEAAGYGDGRFALVLPVGSKHFELRLSRPSWSFASGQTPQVDVAFDAGNAFHFVGVAQGNAIQIALADAQMVGWTHAMTAMRVMTVSFPLSPEEPWTISLAGTTTTVTAMAGALAAAGIVDLPRPWSMSNNTTIPPAVTQASPVAGPVQPSAPASIPAVAENSPDNHCREASFAKLILSEFNSFKSFKEGGIEAIDIEHLITSKADIQGGDMACHGTFVLTNGGRLSGTLEMRPNVAGDVITMWTRDR